MPDDVGAAPQPDSRHDRRLRLRRRCASCVPCGRPDVRVLIDVRQRRGVRGSEYAWANAARLQAALEEAGIDYVHVKELAPTTELRQLQYAEDAREGVGKRSRTRLAPAYVERYTREILDPVGVDAVVEALPPDGARRPLLRRARPGGMPPLADRRARRGRARRRGHAPAPLTQAANHEHHARITIASAPSCTATTTPVDAPSVRRRSAAEEDRPSEEDDQHPEDGALVQRMSLRSMNLIASRHDTSANPTRNARWPTSAQPSNPNTACADELDAVVERVEVAGDLRPCRQLVEREERARDEEHRRQQAALPVGEALDRLRLRRR